MAELTIQKCDVLRIIKGIAGYFAAAGGLEEAARRTSSGL